MKSKYLKNLAVAVVLAGSTLGMVSTADAWWYRYHDGPRYYHHGNFHYGYDVRGCVWIPAHRGPYGGWHPGHRVC